MTTSTPIDRVVQLLESAGYRRLAMPLQIAGLTFNLPAAFVGTNPSPDLILVEDTAFETDQRILSKLEGVARALDVVRSRRPITAVLTGPRPSSAALDAMTKVCRVLPVGTLLDDNQDAGLRNWLAVLLPLSIPASNQAAADPLHEISAHLEGLAPEVVALVDSAVRGAGAVQTRLHETISASLSADGSDGAS